MRDIASFRCLETRFVVIFFGANASRNFCAAVGYFQIRLRIGRGTFDAHAIALEIYRAEHDLILMRKHWYRDLSFLIKFAILRHFTQMKQAGDLHTLGTSR